LQPTAPGGTPIATIADVITRQKVELSLLACAVAISRFAFRSRYLYNLDSVNFALGVGRFDPRAHQPIRPVTFYTSAWAACLLTWFTTPTWRWS